MVVKFMLVISVLLSGGSSERGLSQIFHERAPCDQAATEMTEFFDKLPLEQSIVVRCIEYVTFK